jgi:hypothetical protein
MYRAWCYLFGHKPIFRFDRPNYEPGKICICGRCDKEWIEYPPAMGGIGTSII